MLTQENIHDLEIAEEPYKEEKYKGMNGAERTEVRKNWRACSVKYWNSTTARAYLTECTKAKFKVDYICNNIRQENALISQFIKSYGRHVLKDFIYACMKGYTSNKNYPYPSFHFMYTYLRERYLPGILYKLQQEEERRKELEAQKNVTFTDMSEVW